MEGLIRQFPDLPQRMAGRNPLLNRNVGDQGAAGLSVTLHFRWAVFQLLWRSPVFSAKSEWDRGRSSGGEAMKSAI